MVEMSQTKGQTWGETVGDWTVKDSQKHQDKVKSSKDGISR